MENLHGVRGYAGTLGAPEGSLKMDVDGRREFLRRIYFKNNISTPPRSDNTQYIMCPKNDTVKSQTTKLMNCRLLVQCRATRVCSGPIASRVMFRRYFGTLANNILYVYVYNIGIGMCASYSVVGFRLGSPPSDRKISRAIFATVHRLVTAAVESNPSAYSSG